MKITVYIENPFMSYAKIVTKDMPKVTQPDQVLNAFDYSKDFSNKDSLAKTQYFRATNTAKVVISQRDMQQKPNPYYWACMENNVKIMLM